MAVGHASVLANSMSFKRPVLHGDSIDVHRAVAALRGDVLVQRIPGDTLDIVRVFCDLPNAFACRENR